MEVKMFEVTDLAPIIIRAAIALTGLSVVLSAATLIGGLVAVFRGKMKPQDLVLLLKAPTVYLMRQTQAPRKQRRTKELRFDAEKHRRQARNYRSN
jgi:hypothetical protein